MRKQLKISKVAEIAEIDSNLAQKLLYAIVKQIGESVKAGKAVAFDFKIEDGVSMVISSQGYKFVHREGPSAGRALARGESRNLTNNHLGTESS